MSRFKNSTFEMISFPFEIKLQAPFFYFCFILPTHVLRPGGNVLEPSYQKDTEIYYTIISQ